MACAGDTASLPCLICNGDGEGDQCSGSAKALINQQLDAIFVLRTILEVPYKLLEGFFRNGEHPSEWGIVSLCATCGEEITKCKILFEEMMHVQKRFKEKKEGIIEKIKRRHSSPPAKGNSKLALREKCINFVAKNKYTQLTKPFPEGDLKATELQAVIKQEEEEDPIDGEEVDLEEIRGDFEVMEVEWIVPSDLEKEDDTEDNEYKEESSSDSSKYQPKNLKTKPSPPKSTKKKRGRPKLKEAIKDGTKEIAQKPRTRKFRHRPTNKRGLLPPPPPANPDPSTLTTCPNCKLTKFQKTRGDLLYSHLIQCAKQEETFPWHCQLCKNEVISSPSSSDEHCLRFVEHLNTCQAPSPKDEFEGPYPLSSRLFQCNLCYPLQSSPVFTFPQFLDHCKFHKNYIYQCSYPQCPPTSRFAARNNLRTHWKFHHSSNPSIPFSFTISSILPTLQFWCSHCHSNFPSEILLSQHLISSHPNIPSTPLHTCQYCSKTFPSISLLSLHEHTSHLEQKYFLNCPTCKTYHPTPKSLATHQKSRLHLKNLRDNPIVDPQGSQICEICGVNCEGSETTLQKHMKIFHPSKKVRPIRSGRPPNPNLAKVDSKGRSLQCPQCNKGFYQMTNLNLHVRTIHEGNWPFYCHSCGKGFPTRTTLKKHLASAHGEGDYGALVCQIEGCGKKYFDPELFQCHLNRHKGERMFGCEYCGKGFFGVKQLRVHLLIHTSPDDKPFECKLCPQKFRVSGHLKMHMNLHKKKGDC